MTDTQAETAEIFAAPAPAPDSEASNWPLVPTPAAPTALAPDPLILEVEQTAPIHAPAPTAPAVEPAPVVDPAPSVYGRIDPTPVELAPEPPDPTPIDYPPLPAVVASELAPTPPPPPLAAVAPAEKPLEPEPEPLELVEVVAPLPPRPALTDSHIPQASPTYQLRDGQHASAAHDPIDPVLAGFDHIVALAGYVLLFISVFMFGVPALATMALAYAHKNDAHLLVRSHYRFQLRIFWTAILFTVLAIGSMVTAGGVAVSKLVEVIRSHFPGLDAVMVSANADAWSGEIAGLLVIAAVILAVLAVIWTLGASLFGFLRLAANRSIGHRYVK